MKLTFISFLTLIILCLFSITLSAKARSKNRMNTHYKLKKAAKETAKAKTATVKIAPKSLSAEDLPDVPIYFQTWIKYFNFRKKSPSEPSKKPKYFFKNEAFGKQSLAKDDTKDLVRNLF